MDGCEKKHKQQCCCRYQRLINYLLGFFVLLLACVLTFSVTYSTRRFMELQEEITVLKQYNYQPVVENDDRESAPSVFDRSRDKREVLSSGSVDIKSLIQGPPGPPGPSGPVGPPGSDGRDGRDFVSLELLRGVINETVKKEWTQFSNHLPTYSGATYTRWGRTSCGPQSKLIYKGQMTGPDYRSAGGGSNYQCLPDDPEYDGNAPSNVPHSTLRSVFYEIQLVKDILGNPIHGHRAPCAVCETEQRVTNLMIPAKTRCPDSDWVLEYKGYIMSSAEHHLGGAYVSGEYYRGQYVCVDGNAESVTSQSGSSDGAIIYPVTASCSGDGALANCPPYLSDRRALSCVVCSK